MFKRRFARVVMDEGHRVKNSQTQASNLVAMLDPPYRWILTATPIMNRAIDYVGYLTLLCRQDMLLDTRDHPSPENFLLPYQGEWQPTHTDAYRQGGKYHGTRAWVLDPFLFEKNPVARRIPPPRW